jgi:hypothetical protein
MSEFTEYEPTDALKTSIPSYIIDVVPGMIDGRPSVAVLKMLVSMVKSNNCANTCMDILINDCGHKGRYIAAELAATRPK